MHFREVCKHGLIMRQCRCPGPKVTTVVECNHPATAIDTGWPRVSDEVFDQDRQ